MQKVLGSIAVLISCVGIGIEKAQELQRHLTELELLKRIFTILKKEMEYTKAPFSELFLKMSKKVEGIHGEWLNNLAENLCKYEQETFYEIWNKELEKLFEESKLSKKEKEELRQLGKSMGYIEGIELYLTQLEFSIEQTKAEIGNKKKLCVSLGVMGGIFLVIILL